MKKIIIPLTSAILIILTVVFLNTIVNSLTSFFMINEPVLPTEISIYKKHHDYEYVQNTDSFIPYSNQDLMNILYTTINNGWDQATFYCPPEYIDCKLDMENISSSSQILTHINNFVHPYNSFTNIKVTVSEAGEVTFFIEFLYNEEQINKIDAEVDKIIFDLDINSLNDTDKILTIHDYIINNSKYDILINKNEESPYLSHLAYGPLFDKFATCNGYTDLMAIFLDKLNINNFKIATTPEEISYSSTGHIWNAVYIDNTWKHLDLTWDDPIDENSDKDYLLHDYFLISSEELIENDKGENNLEEHNFNTSIYYEFIGN